MTIVTPGVEPASKLVTGICPQWLRTWAQFAAETTFADLGDDVVARSRLVVLDCIGAIIAGRGEREVRNLVARLPATFGSAPPGSPAMEAFVGGTAGTMLEIDEGNQYARGHPGIHVVPAILALGRAGHVGGRDAITALALGYEIGARIGIASKLRVTMHPHGTWGVVGAALAAAKLAAADAADITAVINVASSLGLTTSRRTMLEGATVRNSYAGFSNMLGLIAWDLVAAGFTGEADGIGAVYGGIAATDWKPEEMTAELGQRWEIARNYFKRHAACRYNHAALDALAEIRGATGGHLDPESIERVDVETYVWAAQLDHQKPANQLAAKFSLPFSLATSIVNGAASIDAFRDAARADPRVTALAARVVVTEDPALTARLPAERPARVRIRLKDGRELAATAWTNKGDTEDPYSPAEVVEKFHEVTVPLIGRDKADRITQFVAALDRQDTLAPLGGLMEAP